MPYYPLICISIWYIKLINKFIGYNINKILYIVDIIIIYINFLI